MDYLRHQNRPDEVNLSLHAFSESGARPGVVFSLLVQMHTVDPDGALKLYAKEANWDKCIELAEKQVCLVAQFI